MSSDSSSVSTVTGAAANPASAASIAHSDGQRQAPAKPRVSGGLRIGPGRDANQLMTSADIS